MSARPRQDIRATSARALLLSTELDRARIKAGFTTRKLAGMMSMSPAMTNRIMNGRRVPDALEMGGLCALLDIPPHRRNHLYKLRAQTGQTDWIIHPTPSKRDPESVVRSLWSLADEITTYATSINGPHALGNSGVSAVQAPPGHHGDTRWTHYISASAIGKIADELDA